MTLDELESEKEGLIVNPNDGPAGFATGLIETPEEFRTMTDEVCKYLIRQSLIIYF